MFGRDLACIDVELIVAFEASSGRSGIACQGAVDDLTVRKMVKEVMEGGEEAFRRRAEKYGSP